MRWCGTDLSSTDRKPDEVSAFEIHVIYAFPLDAADRFSERASGIATDLSAIDAWWAGQDPTRRPRFDLHAFPGCDSYFGRLDLSHVRLPRDAAYYRPNGLRFERISADLAGPAFLFSSLEKKYLVYYDGPVENGTICGEARRGQVEGGAGAYSIVYLGACEADLGLGGLTAVAAAHELVHGLNALPSPFPSPGPPNACPTDQGHVCDSQRDLLFPESTAETTLANVALDLGRNDYYGHGGPWWDVRRSFFLWWLDSQDRNPPVGPADLTATSDGEHVTVSWPAATDDVGPITYRVYKDGELFTTSDLRVTDQAPIGETHVYAVRAADAVGFLGPLLTIRFTVGLGTVDEAGKLLRDTVPPPEVTGLQGKVTKRALVLRWSPVEDPGGLKGYQVTRNGKPFRLVPGTSIAVRLKQARGTWSVAAVDQAGNVGPASGALSVR